MRSYSATDIFSTLELDLLARAERMVAAIPEELDRAHQIVHGSRVRCHELARAVGRLLELHWQDGYYGFVEHTWLWTTAPSRFGLPNILDVYAVGSLPQVRLVACTNPSLPHVGWAYRPAATRTDIDDSLLRRLEEVMRGAMQ